MACGRPQAWFEARYVPAPHDAGWVTLAGSMAWKPAGKWRSGYFSVNAIVVRRCEMQIVVPHGFTRNLMIAASMKILIEATGFVGSPQNRAASPLCAMTIFSATGR